MYVYMERVRSCVYGQRINCITLRQTLRQIKLLDLINTYTHSI